MNTQEQTKKPTITAQCIVKNEECFVAYAIRSVIDYVDAVLVYDTGSTDATIAQVETLIEQYGDKITLRKKGECPPNFHSKLRHEMFLETHTDWFMILDGDEVYAKRTIEEAVAAISAASDDVLWFASPYYLCVGDVHHTYYKEKYYDFFKRVGFFTPRFIRKIEHAYWSGDYGADAIYLPNGKEFFVGENIHFLNNPYWHLTHLKRSSQDDSVYTSGIENTRKGKRRLTYIGIGRKIKEPIPEVFIGSPYEKGISFYTACKEFAVLALLNPRLWFRKIKKQY